MNHGVSGIFHQCNEFIIETVGGNANTVNQTVLLVFNDFVIVSEELGFANGDVGKYTLFFKFMEKFIQLRMIHIVTVESGFGSGMQCVQEMEIDFTMFSFRCTTFIAELATHSTFFC